MKRLQLFALAVIGLVALGAAFTGCDYVEGTAHTYNLGTLQLIDTWPDDGETDVTHDNNPTLTLYFSTKVMVSTIIASGNVSDGVDNGTDNILVVNSQNQKVMGRYQVSASQLEVYFQPGTWSGQTFTPGDLQDNETYGIAVTSAVKNDDGEPIYRSAEVTFSTGATVNPIQGFPPGQGSGGTTPGVTSHPSGTFNYVNANPNYGLNGYLAEQRFAMSWSRLQSGDVVIHGGINGSGVAAGQVSEIADIYSAGANMIIGPSNNLIYPRRNHTSTVLNDGRVLITGGYDGTTIIASAELFDPLHHNFSLVTNTQGVPQNMSTSRWYHTATIMQNGNVFLCGGDDAYVNANTLSSAEVFDVSTATFQTVGNSMNTPRVEHSAALLTNVQVNNTNPIIIMAGQDNVGNFLKSCEIYEPGYGGNGTNGAFKTAASLTAERKRFPAEVLTGQIVDGMVAVFGGLNQSGPDSSVELYDSQAQQWLYLTTKMQFSRSSHCTSLLPGGKKVLISGGNHMPSPNCDYAVVPPQAQPFADCEIFDPELNGSPNNVASLYTTAGFAFTQMDDPANPGTMIQSQMNEPRVLHCSELIGNVIFLAGGVNGWTPPQSCPGGQFTYSDSAEVYTPW